MTSSAPVNSDPGLGLDRALAEEEAFIKGVKRRDAEARRKRTRKIVKEMAEQSTPEARITAAKARANSVHARIDDIAAQADLEAVKAHGDSPVNPIDLDKVRIDDCQTLFTNRAHLPPYLQERLETIQAKINWQTKKGEKNFFNKAVHDNRIPIDKALTTLAHIYGAHDGTGRNLDPRIDAIIECGLYTRIKKGKFEYSRRCQDGEHCELCNYINIADGLKVMLESYDESAFNKGGNWFAFTVAARTDQPAPAARRASGRPNSVLTRSGSILE